MIRFFYYLPLAALLSVAQPTTADDESMIVEEWTSQRQRSEPVQSVPESITILSQDLLNETYRYELEDLEGLSPGLLIDGLGSTPQGAAIAIRGVGSAEASRAFFPAIGVSVDGVYMGTHASRNQLLFDVDSIEVTRGPQGTYGGAPTLGGTIHVNRSAPTGELSVDTRASFGDFSRKRFDAVVNFPIAGNLAGKVSINWRRGGADMMRNIFDGREENEDDLTKGSASFLWKNDTGVSVQYTFDHVSDKSDVPALLNLSSANDLVCQNSVNEANCSIDAEGLKSETDSFEFTSQNFANEREYNLIQHALKATFPVLGHEVKSITAVQTSDEQDSRDLDGTFVDFYSATNRQDYDQFSQELSAFRQLNEKISYVVGGYYQSSDYKFIRNDFYVIEQIANAGMILPGVPTGETRTVDSKQDITLASAFAHLEYKWNNQWSTDIGVRGNRAKSDFSHTVSRPNNFSNGLAATPAILVGDVSRDEVTTSAGFTYVVDNDAIVYGRYSRGFRPGAFDDTVNSVDAASPFGEEQLVNVELGLKSEWYDDRLRLNYALFTNTYRNKLERFTREVPSGRVESVLENAARVETRGHELEIDYLPMDHLRIRASLSHVSSDYVDLTIPDLSGVQTSVNLESLIPTRAPADMFSLSGIYSLPFGEGMVRLFAGYRYTSEYWSTSTIRTGRTPNFAIVNLSAEYAWRDWIFRIFSTNINGKRYLTNVTNVLNSELVSLPAGITATRGLVTTAEVNQPEFTGLEIIWSPRFGK